MRIDGTATIIPIILAAGGRTGKVPKALACFRRQTALSIALQNLGDFSTVVVVLGDRAGQIRPVIPRGVQVVINRNWRKGQLNSLLAGVRRAPPDAAILVYPVDYVLLTRALVRRLVRAWATRPAGKQILLPRFQRRAGHPTLFAAELRAELAGARTAREVVYSNPDRILFLPVRTTAIWEDLDSTESLRAKRRRRN